MTYDNMRMYPMGRRPESPRGPSEALLVIALVAGCIAFWFGMCSWVSTPIRFLCVGLMLFVMIVLLLSQQLRK